MKNLISFILIFFSFVVFSQNNIDKELLEAEKYVDEILEKRPKEVTNIVKLNNGVVKIPKTDDWIDEFDNNIEMYYKIIRKNDKILYISKSDNLWGGIGDWYNAQDFYFNEKGLLLGAVKKEDWFLENKCASQIKYRGIYKNYGNPKLERVDKYYNENFKEINLDSPNCKKSKPQALENAESMDKIAFRDVEGFMKAEKIKYYRDDEESKSVVSEPKKSESIGNFIRGRGATGNAGNPLGRDENGGNRIGVDRKLIAYIPGTMGRGGNPPVNKCSATGSISISYSVDKDGNVVSAKRSGGVLDACIISTSISWVKEFVKAEKANVYSSGIYKITF
jgi:hypothetical protein